MKRVLMIVGGLCVLWCGWVIAAEPETPVEPASPAAAEGRAPALPSFETDFDAALERAKSEGKVLLVEFYQQNCQYCARMMQRVYPSAEVIEFSKQFVWLRIDQNTRGGSVLRRRFASRGTPMYMGVAHDGVTAFYRFSGTMNVKGFMHNLSLMAVSDAACDPKGAPGAEGAKDAAAETAWWFDQARCELRAGHVDSAKAILEQIPLDDPKNASGVVDDALLLLGMVKNCGSRKTGPDEAIRVWERIVREFPESDRGADAVMYIGKAYRELGRQDMVDRISPLIRDYPDGVDVKGCGEVLGSGH